MIDAAGVKFLIDECVTLDLAELAVDRGFIHSAHVSRRKLNGLDDARLMIPILRDDWTFVTSNADDFRPRRGGESLKPCYSGVEIHAGLVCLNLPPGETHVTEVAYFEAALNYICQLDHLINRCVEVDEGPDDSPIPVVSMYDFPPEWGCQ